MARIPMTKGYSQIPEGRYIFGIYDVQYDEDFGKIEIKMVTAKGQTHTERFHIKDSSGLLLEKALGAFSYFAKTAMNNDELEDIDPMELVGHYLEAEVIHNERPSLKDPTKTVTFANLGEKVPAAGFAEHPTPKVQALLGGSRKASGKAPATAGFDLDALLGD